MDKNIILTALNLAMFIINHWAMSRTIKTQNDIIKRDEDLIADITKTVSAAVMKEKSEE